MKLLFDDLQDLHGTSLCADAAGNALGSRALALHDHNLHGACLDALAAADAQLLVDHVDAGLGVLSDGTVLTGSHALAALDAGIGLCASTLCNNLDAGQIGVKLLVESGGAGDHALETGIALGMISYLYLLHYGKTSVIIIIMSAQRTYLILEYNTKFELCKQSNPPSKTFVHTAVI